METYFLEVDNDFLAKEFVYFSSIIASSKFKTARTSYLIDLKRLFDDADKKGDGKIDRKEFEKLIRTYF